AQISKEKGSEEEIINKLIEQHLSNKEKQELQGKPLQSKKDALIKKLGEEQLEEEIIGKLIAQHLSDKEKQELQGKLLQSKKDALIKKLGEEQLKELKTQYLIQLINEDLKKENNIFNNQAYRVQVVIKDGRGRDIITLDGYDTLNPQIQLQDNNYGQPLWITFIPEYDEFGFAKASYTYTFDPAKRINFDLYRAKGRYLFGIGRLFGKTYIADWPKSNWETKGRIKNFDDEGNIELEIESRSLDISSLKIASDGNKLEEIYQGIEGTTAVEFSPFEVPVGSYRIEDGQKYLIGTFEVRFLIVNGIPYTLVTEYFQTLDLSTHLKHVGGKREMLFRNGVLIFDKPSLFERRTVYPKVFSVGDLLKNNTPNAIFRPLLRLFGIQTGAERIIEKIRKEGQIISDNKDFSKSLPQTNREIYRANIKESFKPLILSIVSFVGILAGIIIFLGVGIPYLVNKIWRNRYSKRFDINNSLEIALTGFGFTKAQAQAIIRERRNNGPFESFEDFINRMGWKDKNIEEIFTMYAPLSLSYLKKNYQLKRLKSAIDSAKNFTYNHQQTNTFIENDLNSLQNAQNLKRFFSALWEIYQVELKKQNSAKSVEQMLEKFITLDKIREILSSRHILRLVNRVDKRYAAGLILRKIYEVIRDNEEFKKAIEERVDSLIRKFGLDDHPVFKDQIYTLKKTFLENIFNARLLPEVFTLANDDVISSLAVYSWDDLRKTPPLNRRISSDLVSIERLFVMQVLFQRGLGGLIGQGRLEDFLWQNYVKQIIQNYIQARAPNPDEINLMMDLIIFTREAFSVLLNKELARWENNRDPTGKIMNFQAIITEEVLNDALRYILGIKDPTPEDIGWILKPTTSQKISPLSQQFIQLFNEYVAKYKTLVTVNDRNKLYNEYYEKIRPLILAIIHTVEREEKIRIVKHRLSYWELNVKPALRLIFDKNLRKAVFFKGGPYNQTKEDLLRWVYNFAMIGLVSGLMSYLLVHALKVIGLLS
ncbi:MAG: hypothetical protein NC820_07815, partial [Candidatus Omnitrophica bacterium]|nr:hypothetical protein [Candidatus Omnitrophota bacterium]